MLEIAVRAGLIACLFLDMHVDVSIRFPTRILLPMENDFPSLLPSLRAVCAGGAQDDLETLRRSLVPESS